MARFLFRAERIEELSKLGNQVHDAAALMERITPSAPPHLWHQLLEGDRELSKAYPDFTQAFSAYRLLLTQWNELYDSLWPPDLARAIWSPTGSSQEPDLLIQFLEEDPFFFRSGYAKEIAAKRLLRVDLSEAQGERIASLCLRSLHGVTRREFRYICRLARRVQSRSFLSELKCALDDASTRTRRHALWMTEALSPAGGYPYWNCEEDAHMRLKRAREFLDERLKRGSEH